jgi:hypothetical protein
VTPSRQLHNRWPFDTCVNRTAERFLILRYRHAASHGTKIVAVKALPARLASPTSPSMPCKSQRAIPRPRPVPPAVAVAAVVETNVGLEQGRKRFLIHTRTPCRRQGRSRILLPAVRYRVQQGANVGYRRLAKPGASRYARSATGCRTLTTFAVSDLKATGDKTPAVRFELANTGKLAGADVPQVYLRFAAGKARTRLIGSERVALAPVERRHVSVTTDPCVLASFYTEAHGWRIDAGDFVVSPGKGADDKRLCGHAHVAAQTVKPRPVRHPVGRTGSRPSSSCQRTRSSDVSKLWSPVRERIREVFVEPYQNLFYDVASAGFRGATSRESLRSISSTSRAAVVITLASIGMVE